MSDEPGRLTRVSAPQHTDAPGTTGSSGGWRKLAFVGLAAGGLYLAADHFGVLDNVKTGIGDVFKDAKEALSPTKEPVKLDPLYADFGTRYRVTAPGGTCLYTPDDLRRYRDLCLDNGAVISGFMPKQDGKDKAHNGQWLYTQRLVFGQLNEFYLPRKDVTRIDVYGNPVSTTPKQPELPPSRFQQYADQYTITSVNGSCLYTIDKTPQKTAHCFPTGAVVSGFLSADDRHAPQKAQWLQVAWFESNVPSAYQIQLRDLGPARPNDAQGATPTANIPTR